MKKITSIGEKHKSFFIRAVVEILRGLASFKIPDYAVENGDLLKSRGNMPP